MSNSVKPGNDISRQNHNYMFAVTFLSCPGMDWSPYRCNGPRNDLSQETFAIDIMTAFRYSLKHRRKHVLRSLRPYGEQVLTKP